MKKKKNIILVLLSVFTIFIVTQAKAQTQAKAKYVILVSIDGFRPDFYRDKTWPTPNIRHLAQAGVSCDGAIGLMPTSTYPAHTSIITGVNPVKHGIHYNAFFDVQNGIGDWHINYADIKTTTLWQAARNAGLKTASLSWPVSVGAYRL